MNDDGSLAAIQDTSSFVGQQGSENLNPVWARNMKDVLLIYAQRMLKTVFQGAEIDTCTIFIDTDYETGRVISGEFTNSSDASVRFSFAYEIAPDLRLLVMTNDTGTNG